MAQHLKLWGEARVAISIAARTFVCRLHFGRHLFRQGDGRYRAADWTLLPKDLSWVWPAGGLDRENIKAAAALKPFLLDLSSSVELAPGIKDHVKLAAVFAALNAYTSSRFK